MWGIGTFFRQILASETAEEIHDYAGTPQRLNLRGSCVAHVSIEADFTSLALYAVLHPRPLACKISSGRPT